MASQPEKAHSLPQMVIYDLDGTLTDTSPAAVRMASIADKWEVPLSSAVFSVLKTANKLCSALKRDFGLVSELRQAVWDKLSHEQEDSFVLLSSACASNIPCVLLSNGPRNWGEKVLKRHHLQDFFVQTVFREDVSFIKPDPRALLPVIKEHREKLNYNDTIWVLGDRPSDVMLSLNAASYSFCNFVPVAIQGTAAADTILELQHFNICTDAKVFKSQFEMACHLNPDLNTSLAKVSKTPPEWIVPIDSHLHP
jgi:FMN phosphatase YigB (HAD superfamily)